MSRLVNYQSQEVKSYRTLYYESTNLSTAAGANSVLLDITGEGYLSDVLLTSDRAGVFKVTVDGVIQFQCSPSSRCGIVQLSKLVPTGSGTIYYKFTGTTTSALPTRIAGSLPYITANDQTVAYLIEPIKFKSSLKIEVSNTDGYVAAHQYVITGGIAVW